MTPTTRKAIMKYGYTNCLRAFIWNAEHGEGARTIAQQMPNDGETRIHTTQQADAAINAGRDLSGDNVNRAYGLMKDAYECDSSATREKNLREVRMAMEARKIVG